MIKLKDIIKEINQNRPIVWTIAMARPIARYLNAKIIGSVENKGKSSHDLDLWVKEYNEENIKDILNKYNFEYNGNFCVSPTEMKTKKKFYKGGWQRVHIFIGSNNRRIDIWHNI